jgi:NADPH:quinone reductase-like Zn-dependent oxidoreductase
MLVGTAFALRNLWEDSTMKAIRIHEFGGAEKLRLEEIEKPQPKADEVLSKNAAAGINFADSRCETDRR